MKFEKATRPLDQSAALEELGISNRTKATNNFEVSNADLWLQTRIFGIFWKKCVFLPSHLILETRRTGKNNYGKYVLYLMKSKIGHANFVSASHADFIQCHLFGAAPKKVPENNSLWVNPSWPGPARCPPNDRMRRPVFFFQEGHVLAGWFLNFLLQNQGHTLRTSKSKRQSGKKSDHEYNHYIPFPAFFVIASHHFHLSTNKKDENFRG